MILKAWLIEPPEMLCEEIILKSEPALFGEGSDIDSSICSGIIFSLFIIRGQRYKYSVSKWISFNSI